MDSLLLTSYLAIALQNEAFKIQSAFLVAEYLILSIRLALHFLEHSNVILK